MQRMDFTGPDVTGSALDSLMLQMGVARSDTGGAIDLIGCDPVVPSRHRPGLASAAALAAQGAAIAAIWKFPTYPKHLSRLLDLLGCTNDSTEVMANSVRQWNAVELEDALAERNLVGAVSCSREEWLAQMCR
jgi:hypothetical protein